MLLEILGQGFLGSLFGGIFRLIPEVLKYMDSKNERAHELKMFQEQTSLEKVKGEFVVEGKYVDHSIAQLGAISEAFKQQATEAGSSYKWISAASALVRPGVTYIIFLFYIIFKLLVLAVALETPDVQWQVAIQHIWTAEDFGMLNMILTFWFVGRAIEKRST